MMRTNDVYLIALLCLMATALTPGLIQAQQQQPLRTWTEIQGRTMEAVMLDATENMVRVRRQDGQVFDVPLELLSQADRDYVAAQMAQEDTIQEVVVDPDNLIGNASFEANRLEETMPDFWMRRPAASISQVYVRSGQASLELRGAPAESYTFHGITLLPGQTYELSLWSYSTVEPQGEIRLEYKQIRPVGSTAVRLPVQVVPGEWTQSSVDFRVPDGLLAGRLDLVWKIPEGMSVWLDDIRLTPKEGSPPVAPEPAIVLTKDAETEMVILEMEAPLSQSVIRYTLDGTEPDRYSLAYQRPMHLRSNTEIRARTFHGGYRPSPVAMAQATVAGHEAPGVPFYPVDWTKRVDEWWSEHPFNPLNPDSWYVEVESPAAQIDVAEMRAKHPDSKTAGIAEAIAALPPEGGTLWFPRSGSPYVITKEVEEVSNYYQASGAILILRRSHLHFLSDGAVIQSADGMFGITSMEYADNKTFSKPSRDYYFENLTFDGMGESATAFLFRHVSDVLFKDCRFINYKSPMSRRHPGIVNATSKSDNVWFINCLFDGGQNGVYLDGAHGAGFVNCNFRNGPTHNAILLLTNDDMAPFAPRQRSAQYVVVAGCRFEGSTLTRSATAYTIAGANCLFIDNEMTGPYRAAVQMDGKFSGTVAYLQYEYYHNRVLGNRLDGVHALLRVHGWNTGGYQRYSIGRIVVADNQAAGLVELLDLNPRHEKGRIDAVEVRANSLSGSKLPSILIRHPGVDGIRIEGNAFQGSGSLQDMVEGEGVDGLASGAITIVNNTLNGESQVGTIRVAP